MRGICINIARSSRIFQRTKTCWPSHEDSCIVLVFINKDSCIAMRIEFRVSVPMSHLFMSLINTICRCILFYICIQWCIVTT